MNCDQAHLAISAQLDSEPPEVDPAALEQHLADCAACRAWRERAHTLTRQARLAPARPLSEPPPELLVRLAPPPRQLVDIAQLRVGLLAVAVLQLIITVPALLLGEDREAPLHVAHELGSLELAIAVGLLGVAWRPSHASGAKYLVGAAALGLVLTATVDVLSASTSVPDEVPHLLTVAGWLLLRALADRVPPSHTDHDLSLKAIRTRRHANASHWTAHGLGGRRDRTGVAGAGERRERSRAA
ncbi:MAG: zf-HC2 domain-containing protein [Solirubrobacterales bacterium]|nr:zf-HC2 domain-containing protein [Solirubrobacterales bacterium]